jgi:hypothetical protein
LPCPRRRIIRRSTQRWCDDFLLPFGREISTLSPDELARAKSAGAGLHEFVDTVLSRHGTATGTDDVVGRLLASESSDRLSRARAVCEHRALAPRRTRELDELDRKRRAMLLGIPEVRRDLEDFIPPGRPFRMVTRHLYALTAAVLSFLARSSHLTAAHLESTPLSCSCGADGDDLALRREGSVRPEMDVKNLVTRESPQSF